MNNKEPLVSVYICTYNRSHLLKRAIHSVLSQSYANIQIVVCSDNSTDNTDAVMEEFLQQYSNIMYFKLPVNSGACAARNKAIENSSGMYITGLDDDDYFEEDRVKHFVDNVGLLDSYSFLSTSYYMKKNSSKSVVLSEPFDFTLENILKENLVGNQIFTLRNRVLEIGAFDIKLPAWQDYDLWIRMILRFGTAKRINVSTYTIDVSHEHERISRSDHKIKKSFNLFIEKYKDYPFFCHMKKNLILNVYAYPQVKFNFKLALEFLKQRGIKNTLVIHAKKLKKN
ncbi:glycosyltransferase [Vibrio breoganii]